MSLEEYSAVDLILGKQRSVTIGRGVAGYAFKTFSPELQDVLRRYMAGDGALFVSGSYVATDLWTGGEATPQTALLPRRCCTTPTTATRPPTATGCGS